MASYAEIIAQRAISSLEAQEGFDALSPKEQRDARAAVLQQLNAMDPQFASDPEAENVYAKALSMTPIVAGRRIEASSYTPGLMKGVSATGILAHDPTQIASSILGGLQDEKTRDAAAQDAQTYLTARKGLENNFLIELATKGYEAVGNLFGDKTPYWDNTFGPQTKVATTVIEDALRSYKPELADQALSAGGALGTANQFLGTAAIAGAIGSTGLGAFASQGAKTLLGDLGASAAHQALLGHVAAQVSEGAVFGAYQVAADLTREKLGTGESLGATWDARLGKIAQSFGTGVAFDVATGLLFGGASTALRSIKATYGKQPEAFGALTQSIKDADTIDAARAKVSELMRASDFEPSAVSSLAPDNRDYVQSIGALGKLIDQASTPISPTDPAGVAVFAAGMGFSLEPTDKGFIAKSIVNPAQKKTFTTAPDALVWMSELYKKANPVSEAEARTALGVARAGSQTNTLKIETKGFARPEDFAPDDAVKLLVPTTNGGVSSNNIAGFSRWYLKNAGASEADIARFTVEAGADWKTAQTAANVLRVPKVIGSAADELEYLGKVREKLNNYANGLGLKPSATQRPVSEALNALIEKPALDTLRPRTLEYVVNEKLGGKFAQVQGGIEITWPTGEKATYKTLNDANSAVFSSLVKNGQIDFAEASSLIKSTYGYDLVEKPLAIAGVPTGTSQYGIKAGKKLIARAETLDQLFASRPDLVPKLPNRFAPELLFTDPALSTLKVSRNAAYGSAATIRDLIKDFKGGWVPGKVYSTGPNNKTLYLSASGRPVFVLENAYGTREKFVSGKSAVKALKAGEDSWDTMTREAALRGFTVQPVPDKLGGFLLTDGGDRVLRAQTLDEAASFLKQQERLDAYPEVTGLGDRAVNELEDGFLDNVNKGGTYKVLEKSSTRYEHGVLIKETKAGTVAIPKGDFYISRLAQLIEPVERSFSDLARKSGDDSILRGFRRLESVRNLTDIANRRSQAVLRGILSDSRGRLYPGKTQTFIAELATRPRDTWEQWAKTTQRTLTPDVARATELLRTFYDESGKKFGVDMTRWMTDYVPQLEAVMQGGKFEPSLEGLKQAAKSIWGQDIPKEITFFSMNFRNGLVLDALLGERNAYNLAMAYATQGNKALYVAPVWEELWAKGKEISRAFDEGRVPKSLAERFEAYLEDVMGIKSTQIEKLHSELSLALTKKIAEIEEAALRGASRIPLGGKLAQDKLESGSYRSVISADLLGKMQARMTVHTQGIRPWIALRNTLDLQRAGAILGNSLVTDAYNDVLRNPEYIGALMREGVIEDTLFTVSSTADIAQNRWKELATRGLISSDVLTRAATARAVDKSFDVGLQQISKGRWDLGQFFRKTGLDILAPDLKNSLGQALQSGNVSAARFIARKGMVDKLMFTFRSGTGNLLGRHLLGKAFGKFQNYSFSMIDLTRSVLGSGTAGDRMLRAGRLAGNAFAVYYAAKAVGIDYNGFLPQDSMGVSGGPYWRAAYAILDSTKEGYAGVKARRDLLSLFLTTAYPEPVRRALMDGIQLLNDGRDRDAYLRLVLGAPVTRVP